jgi:hypothetical protein
MDHYTNQQLMLMFDVSEHTVISWLKPPRANRPHLSGRTRQDVQKFMVTNPQYADRVAALYAPEHILEFAYDAPLTT